MRRFGMPTTIATTATAFLLTFTTAFLASADTVQQNELSEKIVLNHTVLESPTGIQVNNNVYLPFHSLSDILQTIGVTSTLQTNQLSITTPWFYTPNVANPLQSSGAAIVIDGTPVESLDMQTDGAGSAYISVQNVEDILNGLQIKTQWDGQTLELNNCIEPTFSDAPFMYQGKTLSLYSLGVQDTDYIPVQSLPSLMDLLGLNSAVSAGGIQITAPSVKAKGGTVGSGSYTIAINGNTTLHINPVQFVDKQGKGVIDYVRATDLTQVLQLLNYTMVKDNGTWSIHDVSQPSAPTQSFKNIVNPFHTYSYRQMEEDIIQLAKVYPDLIRYESLGKTAYGRNIYAVYVGKGKATAFINGSTHAREWLTTNLNMYMIDQYAQAYEKNQVMDGYHVKQLLNQTTLVFIPMVNPDGVTLVQQGAKAFPASVRGRLIAMNGGRTNFSDWKANAQGIDLNRQYPAGWSSIFFDPEPHPIFADYKGTAPFQTDESKAIRKLIQEANPQMEVSYHTAGEFIYWGWHLTGSFRTENYSYAQRLARMTHYTLQWGTNQSGGGFTDWWTHSVQRPGFTIEITPGASDGPVSLAKFKGAWEDNKDIGLYLAQESYRLYQKKVVTTATV